MLLCGRNLIMWQEISAKNIFKKWNGFITCNNFPVVSTQYKPSWRMSTLLKKDKPNRQASELPRCSFLWCHYFLLLVLGGLALRVESQGWCWSQHRSGKLKFPLQLHSLCWRFSQALALARDWVSQSMPALASSIVQAEALIPFSGVPSFLHKVQGLYDLSMVYHCILWKFLQWQKGGIFFLFQWSSLSLKQLLSLLILSSNS